MSPSLTSQTAKKKKSCITLRFLLMILIVCICVLIVLVYSLIDTIKLSHIQSIEDARSAAHTNRIHHLIDPDSGVHELRTKVDMAMEYEMLQRSVYLFHDVCLENGPPQTYNYKLPKRTAKFNVTKRIVVYGHWGSSNRSLAVGGSSNSVFNRWDINLMVDPIPKGHTVLDRTAFFVVQTCPGNFHHFWEDEFRNLFSTVYKMGRLLPNLTNQVLYKLPGDLAPEDMGCFNTSTYSSVLKTLHIDPVHDAFYRIPDKTCFKDAVFGVANFLPNNSRMAVDHVLKSFNIDRAACQKNVLTVIQRTYRRILNPADLMKVAEEVGFSNVQLVTLEELSVEQQAKVAACSRVIVGVQGAGLEWAIFMKEKSTLLEISWPKKFWAAYFRPWMIQYDINHYDLEAKHVRLNWPAYQNIVLQGKELSGKEREYLINNPPKNALDNIWKWGDVLVDETEFKNIILTVYYELNEK